MLWFTIFLIASGVADGPVQPVAESGWHRDVEIVRVERATAGSGVFAICHRITVHVPNSPSEQHFYRLSLTIEEGLPEEGATCDVLTHEDTICSFSGNADHNIPERMIEDFQCRSERWSVSPPAGWVTNTEGDQVVMPDSSTTVASGLTGSSFVPSTFENNESGRLLTIDWQTLEIQDWDFAQRATSCGISCAHWNGLIVMNVLPRWDHRNVPGMQMSGEHVTLVYRGEREISVCNQPIRVRSFSISARENRSDHPISTLNHFDFTGRLIGFGRETDSALYIRRCEVH